MERVARHAFVSGRVQGVAFRWATRERARELGLAGWVRNLDDGRVEAWIEGPAQAVEDMLGWLGRGPSGARVRDVAVAHATPCGARSFEITA